MAKKLSDPYSWRGKNGIGTGKVPIGHFRRETLKPVSEAATRPELQPRKFTDGRGTKGV